MQRQFTYTFSKLNTPISVKNFLRQQGFSRGSMIVLKKQKNSILVNNIPVFITHLLQNGDTLNIRLSEEESSEQIKPVKLPLDILYEDEDLMVLNKPAGMPIHPSQNNRENTLGNALAWYFASQNRPFVFRCINRLDKDTSGLTIVAKHIISAGMLSSMIASKGENGIRREYLAIVHGTVTLPHGIINAPIARKEGSIIRRTVDWECGEHAVTHYQVLDSKNGYSLVSLLLETGRTHQIRVHMKHLGFPLVGDSLYHPETSQMSRQALHAHKLDFKHPITGACMHFTAPVPEDMAWYNTL